MRGPCRKLEIEEVEVEPGEKEDKRDPDAWKSRISTAGAGGAFVYSDGSLLEGGSVGGGALVVERRELENSPHHATRPTTGPC